MNGNDPQPSTSRAVEVASQPAAPGPNSLSMDKLTTNMVHTRIHYVRNLKKAFTIC
jgi:hypothetical protein